jgi:hypothetical protein
MYRTGSEWPQKDDWCSYSGSEAFGSGGSQCRCTGCRQETGSLALFGALAGFAGGESAAVLELERGRAMGMMEAAG